MTNIFVNGINRGWGDILLVLFGIPVVGITEISYKDKQNKENQYGAGNEPVSRGYGKIEYEASLTLYREEWEAIIQASPDKKPRKIPPFEIQVLLLPTGGGQAATDVLKNVEFLEDDMSSKQGDTSIMVTIPLIIAGIDHI